MTMKLKVVRENCYRAKVKTNFDNIDFNHDVKSIDCPVYKRQLLLKKKAKLVISN